MLESSEIPVKNKKKIFLFAHATRYACIFFYYFSQIMKGTLADPFGSDVIV